MRVEAELIELGIGNAFAGLIVSAKEPRTNAQAGRGSCRADVVSRRISGSKGVGQYVAGRYCHIMQSICGVNEYAEYAGIARGNQEFFTGFCC